MKETLNNQIALTSNLKLLNHFRGHNPSSYEEFYFLMFYIYNIGDMFMNGIPKGT